MHTHKITSKSNYIKISLLKKLSLKTNDKQQKLVATYMVDRIDISNRFYTSRKKGRKGSGRGK